MQDTSNRENFWQHQLDDPAVRAEHDARDAETAFVSVPTMSVFDEYRSEFTSAETLWHDAEEAFADAVPTTPVGAMAKLKEVLRLLGDAGFTENDIEVRHLRALVAYEARVVLSPKH